MKNVSFHEQDIESTVTSILQNFVHWRLVLVSRVHEIICSPLFHVSILKFTFLKFEVKKKYSFRNYAFLEIYFLQISGCEHEQILEYSKHHDRPAENCNFEPCMTPLTISSDGNKDVWSNMLSGAGSLYLTTLQPLPLSSILSERNMIISSNSRRGKKCNSMQLDARIYRNKRKQ